MRGWCHQRKKLFALLLNEFIPLFDFSGLGCRMIVRAGPLSEVQHHLSQPLPAPVQ